MPPNATCPPSEATSYAAPAVWERVIQLNGVKNLRDLGGYPTVDGRLTRWRTLFRSDCLDQLDTAGQEWLVDNGLRTAIDLRGDWEVEARPNVFDASERLRYRRVPR